MLRAHCALPGLFHHLSFHLRGVGGMWEHPHIITSVRISSQLPFCLNTHPRTVPHDGCLNQLAGLSISVYLRSLLHALIRQQALHITAALSCSSFRSLTNQPTNQPETCTKRKSRFLELYSHSCVSHCWLNNKHLKL